MNVVLLDKILVADAFEEGKARPGFKYKKKLFVLTHSEPYNGLFVSIGNQFITEPTNTDGCKIIPQSGVIEISSSVLEELEIFFFT